MTQPQEMDCYGVSWEERNPECAGGVDPLYTNPQTGSHVRQRCGLYEQCGRTFKAAEAQKRLQNVAQQQVVPITNLARQGAPAYQSAPLVRTQPTLPAPVATSTVPVRPYAPPPPPHAPTQMVPVPPPQMLHPAQYYPAVMSPVQTLLPHEAAPFLTVVEAPIPGVPTWRRVLAESLRAGFKGVLQQGAFIVDHTPYYYPERK